MILIYNKKYRALPGDPLVTNSPSNTGTTGLISNLVTKIPHNLGQLNPCAATRERRLLLGRKAMANLDTILKSRDITLPTKVRLVKAVVFPVVMYGCEIWTIKKAEHRKIDAFELWC